MDIGARSSSEVLLLVGVVHCTALVPPIPLMRHEVCVSCQLQVGTRANVHTPVHTEGLQLVTDAHQAVSALGHVARGMDVHVPRTVTERHRVTHH